MGIMLPVIYITLVAQVYLNKLIFYRKSVFLHASHLDHILLNTFTISLIMLLLKYTVNKKNRLLFFKAYPLYFIQIQTYERLSSSKPSRLLYFISTT